MVAFFLCIINALNVFIYYDIIAGLDLSLYHSFLTTFCQKTTIQGSSPKIVILASFKPSCPFRAIFRSKASQQNFSPPKILPATSKP